MGKGDECINTLDQSCGCKVASSTSGCLLLSRLLTTQSGKAVDGGSSVRAPAMQEDNWMQVSTWSITAYCSKLCGEAADGRLLSASLCLLTFQTKYKISLKKDGLGLALQHSKLSHCQWYWHPLRVPVAATSDPAPWLCAWENSSKLPKYLDPSYQQGRLGHSC